MADAIKRFIVEAEKIISYNPYQVEKIVLRSFDTWTEADAFIESQLLNSPNESIRTYNIITV